MKNPLNEIYEIIENWDGHLHLIFKQITTQSQVKFRRYLYLYQNLSLKIDYLS